MSQEILFQSAADDLIALKQTREEKIGRAPALVGDGAGNLVGNNGAPWVLCRLGGDVNRLVQAYNGSYITPSEGMSVVLLVKYREGRVDHYEIERQNGSEIYPGYIPGSSGFLPAHHLSHEMRPDQVGGWDTVWDYPRARTELRATPADPPDLTVVVTAGWYAIDGQSYWFGGGSVAALTPPVSGTRYDVIVIDSAGTLSVEAGALTSPPTAIALSSASLMPICAVQLVAGQTTVVETDLLQDVRPFVSWASGLSTLRVKEIDGTPSVFPVTIIRVSNGTLTNDGGGQVTIDTTGTPHPLLDGAQDSDTVAHTPVLGDVIYANGTPKWDALAGNTTGTRKFLRQTGTGAVSAAPAWDTLQRGDVPIVVEDEGTPLTKRTNLNFVGAGVAATDDAGNDATVVTIAGGPDWVINEDHSSACNGATTNFSTTHAFVAGSTLVMLNGVLQRPSTDYTENGGLNGVTFTTAPLTGDILLISYIRSGTGAATTALSNVYIATTGSDTTGDGTVGNPYKTLAKALSVLPDTILSDVTIHVADGTYAEAVDLERFRCQSPVTLTITGNTTTPANVVFTGTTTTADGYTTGALVSGRVRTVLQGVKVNVTADFGAVISDYAYCAIDRCIVTGTIGKHGVTARDFSTADFKGNCTISGFAHNGSRAWGIYIYHHSIGVMSVAGTLTITGTETHAAGIAADMQAQFIVGRGPQESDSVSGCHIAITGVEAGIAAALCSVFQHYASSGSISITNVSTPSSSTGCYSTDNSTWSTNQPITLDHFTTGFYAQCLAYLEAISTRTLSNLGSTSSTALGGVVNLP